MSTEMLINYVPGEECRIALTRDGKLEEFYQERASAEIHVSNIYKGKVTNVEPAIQAAFVDFGLGRNGFLHTSDVHPMYFPGKDREEFEKVGQKTARRDRPPIQKCLKRGDEVLVQVLKEGIGTKGPTVTSYLSIPGRYIVMMPNMERLGVSRKVEDDETRREMRDLLKELDPPEGFGFIIRTAGMGQTKTDLKRDLAYLQRLWKDIEKRRKRLGKRVGELYAESDLVIRTIRDVFTPDIDRIVCDDLDAARRAHGFLAVANPRAKSKVVYYNDRVPLLHRHNVEPQIETISAREVPLPSGGALVFDQTEALVAIDVNSGKSREARDAETNAYKTNQEAVDEICRQLRLRDLGGLVVMDLIDMMQAKHRKSIESRIRNNLKTDRAKSRIGSIGPFGMLEMTRQRMRPSLETSIYADCRHCQGRGYTLSAESVLLSVMRRLAVVMQRPEVKRLELTISPDVAFQLLNRKRTDLTHLEEAFDVPVIVRVGGAALDAVNILPFDANNSELELDESNKLPKAKNEVYRELDESDLEAIMDDDDETAERHEAAKAGVESDDDTDEDDAKSEKDESGEGDDEAPKKKRRRRRRRGGRKHRKASDDDGEGDEKSSDETAEDKSDSDPEEKSKDEADKTEDASDESDDDNEILDPPDKVIDLNISDEPDAEESQDGDGDDSENSDGESEDGEKPKRRRRRRGGRRRRKSSAQKSEDQNDDNDDSDDSKSTGDTEASKGDDNQDDDAADSSNGNLRGGRNNSSAKSDESTESKGDDQPKDESKPEPTPPPKKKFRKRNAPPPPDAVTSGYSNRFANRDDER